MTHLPERGQACRPALQLQGLGGRGGGAGGGRVGGGGVGRGAVGVGGSGGGMGSTINPPQSSTQSSHGLAGAGSGTCGGGSGILPSL